jgi:cell division cycle 2-like
MAAASRKRPASEGACPAAAAAAAPKKRARYNFNKIEDYEMIDELGEGTFGVVARARHRRTGETVAVKWMRGGGAHLDAFVREAGCLAACRGHPSIVQIRDAATDAATGDLYLVMEFVGPSLRDWLTRPLSEDAARSFMRQLLSAAARMHAAPMAMIHRDIKPENVLVSDACELKICDFGCATPVKPPGTPYPEQRVGTLPYCAPELLKGGRCYGTAVDMWALGCMMVEFLIGVPLFTADAEEDVLLQIKDLQEGIACVGSKAFDDLLELSPAGLDLVAGLLNVEPDKRLTATEALEHRWFKEEAAEPPCCVPRLRAVVLGSIG